MAKPVTTNSEIELELTFLAKRLPREINNSSGKKLLDIYVPETGTPHPHLRLRHRGDVFEITKKTPVNNGDSSIQNEVTIKLEPEEFEALAVSSKKKVSKIRHKVMIGGYGAEVDVFQDDLTGLVLIDFEFKTRQEKDSFKAPEVCLVDVTQEPFLAGGLLAGKSYLDIKPELDKLGYHKITKYSAAKHQ